MIAVFIYSMPGYSVPIKERMMYSSCRNAVVQVIETSLNIALEKKLEISSGSELTEEFLQVIIEADKTALLTRFVCSSLSCIP